MANNAFHPKDFKAWVILEGASSALNGNTAAVDAPAITSALLQLDVDSISFPSLNVTQFAGVRSGQGRVANAVDFFHDNKNRATEVSLSGNLHTSTGHTLLLKNIMGSTADPLVLAYNHTGSAGTYGVTSVDNATFTMVLASPDVTDAYNIVMRGCMCTSYSISADMGTDGVMYKWSATISTGLIPILSNTHVEVGAVYTGSPIGMSTLSVKKVNSIDAVLSSFSVNIDSPAVYSGVSSVGYQSFSRGEETSITATANLKLDSVSRDIIGNFDAGTVDAADAFTMTQTSASDYSIAMAQAVLTNAAYSEGDVMMLDVEMKALAGTSGTVLSVDCA